MSELVKASLSKLNPTKRVNKPLPALAPAEGIGAAEGYAKPQPPAAQSGSDAGIASPLTEKDVTLRTYHPAQDIYNSDGTLVKVHPIQSMIMQDANGNSVVMNFGLPDYASIVP
jgi:hypothetical protein